MGYSILYYSMGDDRMLEPRNNFFNSSLRLFDDDFFDGNYTSMRTDIVKKNDQYILSIDMPGMKKENIHIDYENEYLMIQAIREEEKTEEHDYIRKEKYYGSYKRSFYVGTIDDEKIKASYQNGILTVEFPSTIEERNTVRQIKID